MDEADIFKVTHVGIQFISNSTFFFFFFLLNLLSGWDPGSNWSTFQTRNTSCLQKQPHIKCIQVYLFQESVKQSNSYNMDQYKSRGSYSFGGERGGKQTQITATHDANDLCAGGQKPKLCAWVEVRCRCGATVCQWAAEVQHRVRGNEVSVGTGSG